MTKREKLLEQYEDALFSLLMDEFAESEGKAALEENERLKADPNFVVPKELQQRCRRTISHYFAKRSIERMGHIFAGVMRKTAMIALIAMLLFTTAFAVSADVRIKTLNWIIEVFDDRTEFSFVEQESIDNIKNHGKEVVVEWIPEGFSQCNQSENKFAFRMDYCSDDGEEFSIAVFDGTNMKFGVDTEDAEVESVDVQGEEGIMASKNGIIQIAWANQELHSYFNVNGPESMKEDLIKVAQGVKIFT